MRSTPSPLRRFLLWAVVLGAVALVAIALIGRRLPESYSAEATVDLPMTPAQVWEALADFEAHPRAGKQAERVERLADVDGKPSWIEDLGETQLTVTATEWKPEKRMVCTAVDSKVPLTALLVFDITPTQSGCRLVASNQVTIREGTWHTPFLRVAMRTLNGARRHLAGFLEGALPGFRPRDVRWGA